MFTGVFKPCDGGIDCSLQRRVKCACRPDRGGGPGQRSPVADMTDLDDVVFERRYRRRDLEHEGMAPVTDAGRQQVRPKAVGEHLGGHLAIA